MMTGYITEMMKKKWGILTVALLLAVCACDNSYDAALPNTTWSDFEASGAKPLDRVARRNMEGVYKVAGGADHFGDQVALKWSFVSSVLDSTYYLSVVGSKDIVYCVLEGKKSGTSMIFNGY